MADPEVVKAASGDELLARLVQSRMPDGPEPPAERASQFLHPNWEQVLDPTLFHDMEQAVDLVRKAAASNRPVHIFGDYDVDGTSASAILFLALKKLGIAATVSLPSRTGRGYGLHQEDVAEIPDGALLITVDCGITAVSEIDEARRRSIDVILTDHHVPPEVLPTATCILNPKVAGETYPDRDLCGAGIAFKMAQALLGDGARDLVDLAGVATMADVVPLVGENRALASLAIHRLNTHPSAGLGALAAKLWPEGRTISSQDISFSIVPTLNAAGRISTARLAFDLLTAPSPAIATVIALSLMRSNETRKQVQETVFREACAQLDGGDIPYFIVLYEDGWHVGVIGPVAAKIAEKYQRPTLLLTLVNGAYVGSARSANGVHLHQVMSPFESLTVRFGGHADAAGVTVLPENLPAYRGELQAYARKHKEQFTRTPPVPYDVELALPFSEDICRTFSRLEPFGEGNKEPVVLVRDARIDGVRGMGGNRHCSFEVRTNSQSVRGVAFGVSPDGMPAAGDVAGNVQMSSFSGRPELIVRKISTEAKKDAEDDFFAVALDNIRHRARTLPAQAYFREKQRLGLIYSALKATGRAEGGMSRNDQYVAMRAKIPDLRREETAFAWAVFSELHLISGLLDDKIEVAPVSHKQNLEDSRVYAAFRKYALAASKQAR